MDCIFCKIAAGEIPCYKIYEDDRAVAFLDIHPVNRGHVLIIPKSHYEVMPDTPDELVSYLFVIAKKLMVAVKKATGAYFVEVCVMGIDVPHFHIHLIPVHKDDSLTQWPTKKYLEGEAKDVREKIIKHI
jgi:histidine triad (HIT) family protein